MGFAVDCCKATYQVWILEFLILDVALGILSAICTKDRRLALEVIGCAWLLRICSEERSVVAAHVLWNDMLDK